jgi:hypothetical protein
MGLLDLYNVCIIHSCALTCENNNEIYSTFTKSEDSIIIIVTRLWAGRTVVQILAEVRIFFKIVHADSGADPASYSVSTGILSQG